MPYLLIAGPECSLEQRKIMASELTEAILNALQLPEESRNWITVHFFPILSEQLAIGGNLLSSMEETAYYCQFLDINLNTQKKEALTLHLFPLLMELLGVPAAQAHRIKLLFQDCPADNVVIGGRFLQDLLASQQI